MSLVKCGLIGLVASFSFVAGAWADQDPIPLITWMPGDPPIFELFFNNHIHDEPSNKVFQFVGDAQSLFAVPTTFDILIYFDYTDASGGTVIIPPAPFGYHNVLPADGLLHHIEGGPYTLDFCPQHVSIHFEIASEVPIQLQGLFDHTCVIIPEASAVALCAFGGVGLLAVWCAAAVSDCVFGTSEAIRCLLNPGRGFTPRPVR